MVVASKKYFYIYRDYNLGISKYKNAKVISLPIKFVLPVTLTAAGLGAAIAIFVSMLALNQSVSILLVSGFSIGVILYGVTLYFAMMGHKFAITVYFCLILFLMDASFRMRDFQDVSMDWQSLLKLAVWGGALLIGIVHFSSTRHSIIHTPVAALLLYAVWALTSTLWSESPYYTLGAAVSFMSLLLFAPVVIEKLTLQQILKAAVISFFVFLVLSWVLYFALPDMGRSIFISDSGSKVPRLNGLAGQPTNLGRVSACLVGAAFLLVHLGFVRKRVALPLMLFGFVTLLFTQTRTALGGILLAIGFLFFRRRPVLLLLFLIVGLGSFFFIQFELSEMNTTALLLHLSRSGNVEELITLTSRTDIWQFVLEKVRESPLIGHGYASSRVLISSGFASKWGWTTGSSHNMLLQNLLTTGIIGTIFVLFLLIRQAKQMFSDPSPFSDLIFIFIFINGLTEAIVLGGTPSMLSLLWMLSLYWREKKT